MINKNKISLSKIIKTVAGIALAIWIFKTYRSGRMLGNNVAADLANNQAAQIINTATNSSGLSPNRIQTVTKVAEGIYNALFKYMFGMFEDERAVITNFNQLQSIPEAILCARLYAASYNKNLYQDIMRYLLPVERSDLNTAYFNAIKSI